jgi:glycosyltransferase involved in cell wall biosynthesis
MRVHSHLYSYPPLRMLGSELMTSELLEALASRGHEVRVATIADTRPYDRRGVRVSARMIDLLATDEDRPDVFVTHPELAEFNFHRAKGLGAKCVAVVHNVRDEALRGLAQHRFDLVVANCSETQRVLAEHGIDSVVIRPPTRLLAPPSAPLPRRFVTLVNLTPDKGGHLFYQLADARPDLHFLGVVGGYGEQVIEERPNVTLMSPTDAMGLVYALSRVVIMPSVHESWGRVGCEALALGIPVIATPLPGLMEALGEGATWAGLDIEDWTTALDALDDYDDWLSASFAAHCRGEELLALTRKDMDTWAETVESL